MNEILLSQRLSQIDSIDIFIPYSDLSNFIFESIEFFCSIFKIKKNAEILIQRENQKQKRKQQLIDQYLFLNDLRKQMAELNNQSTSQLQIKPNGTENSSLFQNSPHQTTKNEEPDYIQQSSPSLKQEESDHSFKNIQEGSGQKPQPPQPGYTYTPGKQEQGQKIPEQNQPQTTNQGLNQIPSENKSDRENESDWDYNSQPDQAKPEEQDQPKYINQPDIQEEEDYDPNEQYSDFSNPKQQKANLGYDVNIYNSNRMYGAQIPRNRANFPPKSDPNGYYGNKNPPSNYEYVSYKNSDGKHLDEHYRRNFVKMLLDKTRGLQKHLVNQIVVRQAQRIKVYANEVSIWLCIYRIVFAIEAQKQKRKLSDMEVSNRIQQKLIEYLNQNPNEKKYKFIKICNRTFRALRIKKCTGDYWLRELFKKYQRKLNPQIETSSLLRKMHKNQANQQNPFDDDTMFESNNQSNYLELRSQQNSEYQNGNSYPAETRQKIIRKMDKSIESAIMRIFHQKIAEFCISPQEMKKWYAHFGKFKLFNPQEQVPTFRSSQFLRPGLNPQQPIISSSKRAELQILNFVKHNPNCTRAKVYNYACSLVQKMHIQELQTQAIFSNWFNQLMLTHCTIYNEYVQLRNNTNFQISMGANQIRPPIQMPQFIQPKRNADNMFD